MEPAPSPQLRFRAYAAPHWRALTALSATLAVATALPLAGPQLLRRFVDNAAQGAATGALLMIAVIYLAVALGAQALNVAVTYWTGQLAWRASNELREDLAAHVLGLDLSFHMHRTAGELIERIDGDVTSLAEFVARFLLQVVGSLLLLLGAVALVFREDARIGLALVAFLVAAAIALPRLQRRTVHAAAAEREAQALLLGSMEERLAALDDLRALGAGPHAMVRFHERSADLYGAHLRWQWMSGGVFAATNLVFALGIALLLGMGIVLLRQGAITTGTVLLLFQYASLVRRPLEQIIGQFKEFQEAAAGATRVRELMTITPSMRDGEQRLPSGALSVRFDNVTFAYPDDPAVLHDFSLQLAAGRSLGVVGRTGSGKTTIARLLLRLYDPTEGSVALGGVDLRTATLASLRSQVRMVTQDVQLFAASVRDNLTLFSETDADLAAVLDELDLGRWVHSLPNGLDTMISPGSVSAGEAQLLALARVFLADPGLVVMDEASSRLDPGTEAIIEAAIDRLLRDRTAVVIAHRLSSLARVDDIAVIDNGRLVEHGARDELAANPESRFGRLLTLSGVTVP